MLVVSNALLVLLCVCSIVLVDVCCDGVFYVEYSSAVFDGCFKSHV